MRRFLRHVSWQAVLLAACLLLCSLLVYAWYVRNAAAKLISSAIEIHSIADAQRQIASWQDTAGLYTESQSPVGSGRAYSLQRGNGILSTLRIVPSTGITVEAITDSGNLKLVVIGIYTNRSSVWLQEVFGAESSDGIKVNVQRDSNGRPVKALLTFGAGLSEDKKRAAFSLNRDCLVKPGGCKTAAEILPTLSEFESVEKTSALMPHLLTRAR